MDIHFLGVLGYQPYRHKHTSCIMIPEYGIVLDAGTGFHLVREHVQTSHLDIFLSHLHDDHVCGILYQLGVLYKKAVCDIAIYGRKGVGEFLRKWQFRHPRFPVDVPGHEQILHASVNFFDVLPNQRNGALKTGQWQIVERPGLSYIVHVFRLPHLSGGSLAYDFLINGKRIAYVTDTTLDLAHKNVRRFAQMLQTGLPPDLLIAECNFANRHEEFARATGHTFSHILAEFLKKVRPRNVVLTHLHPHSDEYGGDFFQEDILAWEEVQQGCGKSVSLARQEMIFVV